MKIVAPHRCVLIVLMLWLSSIAHATQSDAEKAGFAVTPDMRAAMQQKGAETPKAWLGNAIQYGYQTDPMGIEVGQRYRLPEARKLCAAGDTDACTTTRGIEKWLAWAKAIPAPMLKGCDRSPCAHIPDNLVPPALKGKFWVLHAWASWCPYCRLDHSRLLDLGSDKRLRLVSLVYQDSEAEAARYLADHGNPYTGGNIKASREILSSLELHAVPATFVISPKGEILQRFQGTLGDDGGKALKKYAVK